MNPQATEAPPRRLLVVDDELVERMLVARAVAPLGFAVDTAGSIEEATGLLRRHVYQAVGTTWRWAKARGSACCLHCRPARSMRC